MAYELSIEPKAQRFLKKLKRKNPDAASAIAVEILELKNDPRTPRPNEDIYHSCELIKDGFFS